MDKDNERAELIARLKWWVNNTDNPAEKDIAEAAAMLEAQPAEQAKGQEAVAIRQFRKQYCSDWYDGVPDYTDGCVSYETRTLYTTPLAQPARYRPTAQEVKELRSAFSKMHRRWDGEETACARLMDCQEVLIKHGGDQLLALEELRVMYAPKATAQPAREWVELSDADMAVLWANHGLFDSQINAVDKALREKNT